MINGDFVCTDKISKNMCWLNVDQMLTLQWRFKWKKVEKSEKCRDSKFDINENVDNQI